VDEARTARYRDSIPMPPRGLAMSISVSLDRRTMLAVLAACAVPGSDANAVTDYQWKKRPIVVFTPTDSDARFIRQKAMINGNRTSLLDRDVVVVYVVGATVSHDLGPGPGMSGSALRARFRATEGAFRALLVGKDGGVKLDSPAPLTVTEIMSEIDRMPMRRDELRKRSNERT
jgi:Domain of unknown function (DUF4174)